MSGFCFLSFFFDLAIVYSFPGSYETIFPSLFPWVLEVVRVAYSFPPHLFYIQISRKALVVKLDFRQVLKFSTNWNPLDKQMSLRYLDTHRQSHVGKLDRAQDEVSKRGWTAVDLKSDWEVIYPF